MLAIAVQTAGPNWLKFFEGTNRLTLELFQNFNFLFPRATPGTSASLYNKALCSIFINIFVSYSWPNGWTEWADIFCGYPWVPFFKSELLCI